MFRRLSRFAGRRRFRSAEGRRNEQVPECGQPLRGSPHRPSEYLPLQFIAASDLRSSDAAGGNAGEAVYLPPPPAWPVVTRSNSPCCWPPMRFRSYALLRFYPPERRTPATPAARRSVPCTSNGSTTNHYESKNQRSCYWKKNISIYGCAASWSGSKQ